MSDNYFGSILFNHAMYPIEAAKSRELLSQSRSNTKVLEWVYGS